MSLKQKDNRANVFQLDIITMNHKKQFKKISNMTIAYQV